jgi:hypothetical protein
MPRCADDSSQKIAGAEQTDQADDDQIDRDDIVQQARHDQNQDAGNKGDQWSKSEADIHMKVLSFARRWKMMA